MQENHDFAGYVALGSTLPITFQTTNASGTPTAPSASPTYTIYGPDGAMRNGTGTATLLSGTTVYRISVTPGQSDEYERGKNYSVVVTFTASVARGPTFSFGVV